MRILSIVFSCITIYAACAAEKKLHTEVIHIINSQGISKTLIVELARTQAEQERGFMERTEIPDGTGMLFVYQKDSVLHFWMKNTPHPLSIAYVDSKGKIREIRSLKPFSLEPISSSSSVRYALEVPEGWFERNGIKKGDSLSQESLALLQR
ncbi:DUF192 domain-containing protein [Treponema phagedenis]|uniref:DUF192 domain-containing protein n=1 Tax=Treponema phagedenis TaxID=162 RepID=A0A0B7GUU3_TREPH|nr:DUF192 domain-containing protein [Treponema phagedenis]EFW39174.1 putative ACR, COG1430 [Treponema phagedenis F0421]NVP25115.1 DUF192 domain-containing protein [Treponema phagedenis]QEJ94116.1 DUF192 domain-containing protein [Treponema phagedenis]QEJ97229.1 DUF192 domain-containing protein [Treponema phagedenis]QEK01873.1 DUF192 domain-containing protein [Treponema phagedenis]